jgi:FkbM family methyltransferase
MIAEFSKWFSDNGEHLRYDYDLNEDSVVFDVGTYNGNFSKIISDKFNCHIYGFEPVGEYFCRSIRTLCDYPKVQLFNFGLGKENRIDKIILSEDSSSIFQTVGKFKLPTEEIFIKSIKHVIDDLGLVSVDLIKLNVEGCEYEILESILNSGYIRLFKNIQVQFHENIPNCYSLRKNLIERILETHEATYIYAFVWESFRRVK